MKLSDVVLRGMERPSPINLYPRSVVTQYDLANRNRVSNEIRVEAAHAYPIERAPNDLDQSEEIHYHYPHGSGSAAGEG
jgi:hypothetical protein